MEPKFNSGECCQCNLKTRLRLYTKEKICRDVRGKIAEGRSVATTTQARPIEPKKLNALLGQAVQEMGAALHAALIVIGDRLGLYRAMADGAAVSRRSWQRERLGLGAQAGESRIRQMVTAGGFTRFRRATETPFNLVFEAKL